MENISNYQNKVLDKLYPGLEKIRHFGKTTPQKKTDLFNRRCIKTQ